MKHANRTAACQKPRRSWRGNTLLRRTIVALSCLLFAVSSAHAQQKPSEYQVEAAYLYNFGRFIEWPTTAVAKGDSFTVCVLGEDPFGPTLDSTLAGESIGGKRAIAKRISTAQESAGCHILFLSAADSRQLNRIMGDVAKQGVLTVSDMPHFSQRGGMIQFVLEGTRIRFEVNLTATEHAGLALSSELLRVAAKVRRDGSSGD